VRTILVSSRSMCSGCWKWLSLFDSRAIAERCRREFKKIFSLFPRESSRIGHACADYSWDDRLLPPSSWKFLYAQQATDWFIQEREKFQELQYLLSCFPTKTRLCFIAISSYWCNCLWAITILLIFLELYTVVRILRIQQPYSLTSIETIYWDILSLQYDSI
jgi:hypothetical protein